MSNASRRSATRNGSDTAIRCEAVGKYTSNGATVDGELTGAGTQPGAGDGFLATAGGLGERLVAMINTSTFERSAGGRARNRQRRRRLGGVGMVGTGVHLELGQHLTTERALRQHAP